MFFFIFQFGFPCPRGTGNALEILGFKGLGSMVRVRDLQEGQVKG